MKLLVFARPYLKPYLEKLLANSSNKADIVWLSEQAQSEEGIAVQEQLAQADGYDAILLTDGGGLFPESGLLTAKLPLVIPRAHHTVSLLLGGAESYRRLFLRFGGAIAWYLPGSGKKVLDCAQAECACLCYLADTQLLLPDDSLAARFNAQQNFWDYFNAETDLSLLEALLNGEWDDQRIAVIDSGETAKLSYKKSIIE